MNLINVKKHLETFSKEHTSSQELQLLNSLKRKVGETLEACFGFLGWEELVNKNLFSIFFLEHLFFYNPIPIVDFVVANW
jgi:hypothetical protein